MNTGRNWENLAHVMCNVQITNCVVKRWGALKLCRNLGGKWSYQLEMPCTEDIQ